MESWDIRISLLRTKKKLNCLEYSFLDHIWFDMLTGWITDDIPQAKNGIALSVGIDVLPLLKC